MMTETQLAALIDDVTDEMGAPLDYSVRHALAREILEAWPASESLDAGS
jgi:hypothetical protein